MGLRVELRVRVEVEVGVELERGSGQGQASGPERSCILRRLQTSGFLPEGMFGFLNCSGWKMRRARGRVTAHSFLSLWFVRLSLRGLVANRGGVTLVTSFPD